MSSSVYAHLIYGFVVLNDEGEPAEESPPSWLLKDPKNEDSEISDIEDIVSRLENIQPPVEEFDGDNQEVIEKYKEYWKVKRDAGEKTGVELVSHCRSEYEMWILGVKESHQSESRGEVGHFGQKIEAKPEWREVLKTFCDRAGIPFTEPEWLLAPYSE